MRSGGYYKGLHTERDLHSNAAMLPRRHTLTTQSEFLVTHGDECPADPAATGRARPVADP